MNAIVDKWFGQKAFLKPVQSAIALCVTSLAISLSPNLVNAAEKVIFTYGGLTQSVPLEELQAFAETGEVSPSIKTLLDHSDRNPFMMRWILRQEFPANNKIISDLFNTAPNVKALRGALIASASDNNLVSLMELLENYPTKDVYVNGKILARVRANFDRFVEDTSQYIKLPLEPPQN